MAKRVLAPSPLEHRLASYKGITQLPAATHAPVDPPWDAGFQAELDFECKVAERFISDTTYGTSSVNPWLILALRRRIQTLESQNEALRQMKGA